MNHKTKACRIDNDIVHLVWHMRTLSLGSQNLFTILRDAENKNTLQLINKILKTLHVTKSGPINNIYLHHIQYTKRPQQWKCLSI